jgi:aminoglycoside phosphotransferase
MHTVPELVAQASEVGLVTHREVQDGVVSVRDQSGSNHPVHAILVRDHAVGYVKEQGCPGGRDGHDVIARERQTLAYLDELDLGPRLLDRTPGEALWVGVVKGVGLERQHGNICQLAEICQSWGAAVGELHRMSTTGPGITYAPQPWSLHPDHRPPTMRAVSRNSAGATVLQAIESEPLLRVAAHEACQRWRARHWIHGDLTAANVVVQTAPSVRVRFVDFEDAGLGDPTWDLATVLDSITWLAPRWHTLPQPLIEYFLSGYRRSGGPGVLYPAMQAVRAVATAWQVAQTELDSSDPDALRAEVSAWLDRARHFAVRAVAQPRAAA